MAIVTELVVDQFGAFVRKHQGRLQVIVKEEKVAEAPLMHLQRVIVSGRGVSLSSDLIAACCEEGIPIHFLDSHGHPYAALYSAGLTGTVLSRREQLAAYLDQRGVEVGRALAHAKIANQAAFLRYVAKYRQETVAFHRRPGGALLLARAARDCARRVRLARSHRPGCPGPHQRGPQLWLRHPVWAGRARSAVGRAGPLFRVRPYRPAGQTFPGL